MNTEEQNGPPSESRHIDGYGERTDGHDPLECTWLPPRIPLEAVEPIIIPEMLREETEELRARSGRAKQKGGSVDWRRIFGLCYAQ